MLYLKLKVKVYNLEPTDLYIYFKFLEKTTRMHNDYKMPPC